MSNYLRSTVMRAAMATHIPCRTLGPWEITRSQTAKPIVKPTTSGRKAILPPGIYTSLFCHVGEARSLDSAIVGELVMHDHPDELETHLDFMLKARGDVLITGLGLGCVARGCAANPDVKSVTVIERDARVIELVWPYMPRGMKLVAGDAMQWAQTTQDRFTCAWHDLWSDPDKQEHSLQVNHAELLYHLAQRAEFQGCWNMPRHIRRIWRRIIPLL